MYFILYVLHDIDLLDAVLQAQKMRCSWCYHSCKYRARSISRQTSTRRSSTDLSLEDILENYHATNRTLFTIVKSREMHLVVEEIEKAL